MRYQYTINFDPIQIAVVVLGILMLVGVVTLTAQSVLILFLLHFVELSFSWTRTR